MTTIAPSILACDFLNIESELQALKNIPNLWLHLDIMDGHFVPNLTFGHPIVELISKKTTIPLDAHFMVTNPEFFADTMKDLNLFNFTFHFEAVQDPIALVKKCKQYFPSVGISIKPNTPITALDLKLLQCLDLVLVMSVEPGFGGQKFMPTSLEKLKYLNELKTKHQLNLNLEIDGGINLETAKLARDHGATHLVAGSYIFNNDQSLYSEKIESLR